MRTEKETLDFIEKIQIKKNDVMKEYNFEIRKTLLFRDKKKEEKLLRSWDNLHLMQLALKWSNNSIDELHLEF